MTNVYCAFYNSATAYALFLLLIDMHAEWWNHPCCAPLCSYAWMTFHRPHSSEWWVQTTWNIYIYIYHSHKSLEQYNYLHVRWINYSFYTLPFSMKAGNYIATFGEILILLYITIIHDIVSNSNLMIVCEPKNMNKLHYFSERTDKNFNGICLFLHFMQI